MPAPLTVTRNPYTENRKESTIVTPHSVCEQIARIILTSYQPKSVLDIGCGDGRLALPFYESCAVTYGIDIDDVPRKGVDHFILAPFSYAALENVPKPDLAISNPPFNHKQAGKRTLLPFEWLKILFSRYGETLPVVMVVPMGFRLNQRRASARYQWLMESHAEITGIISLPLDTFVGVQFHCEVLIFNIPNVAPHSFLHFV